MLEVLEGTGASVGAAPRGGPASLPDFNGHRLAVEGRAARVLSFGLWSVAIVVQALLVQGLGTVDVERSACRLVCCWCSTRSDA